MPNTSIHSRSKRSRRQLSGRHSVSGLEGLWGPSTTQKAEGTPSSRRSGSMELPSWACWNRQPRSRGELRQPCSQKDLALDCFISSTEGKWGSISAPLGQLPSPCARCLLLCCLPWEPTGPEFLASGMSPQVPPELEEETLSWSEQSWNHRPGYCWWLGVTQASCVPPHLSGSSPGPRR